MADQMPKMKKTIYTIYIKRILDVFLSGAAIVILSPLLIIITIFVFIYHGRPILFAQNRPGKNGKVFKVYKFRSMTNDKDENGNLLSEEQRLTAFGKLIRRLSLDELPELFCILTGKMSVIGPRPLLTRYLPLYTERHMHRHDIRPGFACVPLKPMNTWTWNDQFENDIWYIENCSFLVDVKMILAVLREAVAGAEYRVSGTREEFIGTNLYADAKGGSTNESSSNSSA